MNNIVYEAVRRSVRDSLRISVWWSVRNSVMDSVYITVQNSVEDYFKINK